MPNNKGEQSMSRIMVVWAFFCLCMAMIVPSFGQGEALAADQTRFSVRAVPTTTDRTTSDREVLFLGRIFSTDLPSEELTVRATITHAGVKGAHGIWCFNERLNRHCARKERTERINPGAYVRVPEGYVYDFAWTAKVAADSQPMATFIVAFEASPEATISIGIDPSAPARWYLAAPRYVRDRSAITLPSATDVAPEGRVQFITYACLRPPYPQTLLYDGDNEFDVFIEDAGHPGGCKWWVTKPMLMSPGSWILNPLTTPSFIQEVYSFDVSPSLDGFEQRYRQYTR